jgi:2-phosphosulfolactate phosphatase
MDRRIGSTISPLMKHSSPAAPDIDCDLFCEWGREAVEHYSKYFDVAIIIDVLSFTTCVDIGVERGARIYPWPHKERGGAEFARRQGAILAGRRGEGRLSLSPQSMRVLVGGERVVLPSLNGSALSLLSESKVTLAGSLRSAQAVANWAKQIGERVLFIPAGEQWSDGRLRPAYEDWLGVGAIARGLRGRSASPEIQAACAAFEDAHSELRERLYRCRSGRELIELGYRGDVDLASEIDVSSSVPLLVRATDEAAPHYQAAAESG